MYSRRSDVPILAPRKVCGSGAGWPQARGTYRLIALALTAREPAFCAGEVAKVSEYHDEDLDEQFDYVSDDDGFSTPEEAALAEWSDMPEAAVRVTSVEYLSDDRALVDTDTLPSHPMTNWCVRVRGLWHYTGDHN